MAETSCDLFSICNRGQVQPSWGFPMLADHSRLHRSKHGCIKLRLPVEVDNRLLLRRRPELSAWSI